MPPAPQHRTPPIEILHLAYTYFPADTRVKREVEALQTTGRRLAVIALRGPNERPVERWNGVTIVRVPGRKSRGGVGSYVGEYGAFVLRCRRLVARHRAFAHVLVVHVHTLPDFLMWAALPARDRGARVVFDMHEIFPEFVRSKFPGALGRPIAALAHRIERWARDRADLTIIVNQPIEQLLVSRPIGRPEHRIVLHNTADPADFGNPMAAIPDPTSSSLELIYHGTLTFLYGLDVAIRATAVARKEGLNVHLTILGDGPERGVLRRLASRLDLENHVAFEAPIRQHDLPARLRRCAAGVVPTRLDGMTRYSLSTKLLEYVHLGIPVLAARLPSYERYLSHDTLWYWTAGDPEDLARVMREFAATPAAERSRRAQLAWDAIAPLAWTTERRQLLEAYDRLLASDSDRTDAIRSAALPSP
jgi:glycosyltransferase involved in cell wall biosynthesis